METTSFKNDRDSISLSEKKNRAVSGVVWFCDCNVCWCWLLLMLLLWLLLLLCCWKRFSLLNLFPVVKLFVPIDKSLSIVSRKSSKSSNSLFFCLIVSVVCKVCWFEIEDEISCDCWGCCCWGGRDESEGVVLEVEEEETVEEEEVGRDSFWWCEVEELVEEEITGEGREREDSLDCCCELEEEEDWEEDCFKEIEEEGRGRGLEREEESEGEVKGGEGREEEELEREGSLCCCCCVCWELWEEEEEEDWIEWEIFVFISPFKTLLRFNLAANSLIKK